MFSLSRPVAPGAGGSLFVRICIPAVRISEPTLPDVPGHGDAVQPAAQMRALITTGDDDLLRLTEVPDPEATANEALVRVQAITRSVRPL